MKRFMLHFFYGQNIVGKGYFLLVRAFYLLEHSKGIPLVLPT